MRIVALETPKVLAIIRVVVDPSDWTPPLARGRVQGGGPDGESTKESFTLTNSSSIPVTVRLEATIDPPGLKVEIPGEVEVPEGGQELFDITIKAPPYIEPGEYTIRIDVMR